MSASSDVQAQPQAQSQSSEQSSKPEEKSSGSPSRGVQLKASLAGASYDKASTMLGYPGPFANHAALQAPSGAPVQARGGELSGGDVHSLASYGTSGGGGSLPHLDTIQQSFGKHDVSGVRSFVGGRAAEAAGAMGADAYATGNTTAHKSAPSLHEAAHEAAHVVQQRQGVQLKGGVGQVGDAYERHADRVADAVVAGKSAESLLDSGPSGGSSGFGVQMRATSEDTVSDEERELIRQRAEERGGSLVSHGSTMDARRRDAGPGQVARGASSMARYPAVEAHAQLLERNLGANAFSHPRADGAAATLATKAKDYIIARAGERWDANSARLGQILQLTAGNSAGWSGAVGDSIEALMRAFDEGNVAVRMSHIGQFWTEVFGQDVANREEDLDEWLEGGGFDMEEVDRRRDATSKYGVTLTTSDSEVRGQGMTRVVDNPDSTTHRDPNLTLADAGVTMTPDEIALQNEAYQREQGRDFDPASDPVLWELGARKWIMNEENRWVRTMRQLSLPLAAGPSGTTNMLMNAAQTMGGVDMVDARLACIGYLLPYQHHSLVEIMVAADPFVPGRFEPSVDFYRHVAPYDVATLRGFGNGRFPDEVQREEEQREAAEAASAPETETEAPTPAEASEPTDQVIASQIPLTVTPAISEGLGLSDTGSDWKLTLALSGGALVAWVGEGASRVGRMVSGAIGGLLDGVRAAIGAGMAALASVLRTAGATARDLLRRLRVSDGRLYVDLGPGRNAQQRRAQHVGFSLQEMLEAVLGGTLSSIRPSVVNLSTDGASVTLQEASGEEPLEINTGMGADAQIGAMAVDTVPLVRELLRMDAEDERETMLGVWWDGTSFALTLTPSTDPTHGIAAVLDIPALQARFEAALGGFGERVSQWLSNIRSGGSGGGSGGGRNWLSSVTPSFSGGRLTFDFSDEVQLGLNLANQISSVIGSAGFELSALIPDHFHFAFPDIGLEIGADSEVDPFAEASFSALGSISVSPLPAMITEFVSGLTGEASEEGGSCNVRLGYKQDGGLQLGVGISVDVPQLGSRHFLGQVDLSGLVERARGMLDSIASSGGNSEPPAFVTWIRGIASGAPGVAFDPATQLHFRHPGIVQFADAHNNRIGFDLTQFLDGFDAADFVPCELAYDGNEVDLAYGESTSEDSVGGSSEGVLVGPPEGSSWGTVSLPAPDFVLAPLGLEAGAEIEVSLFADDDGRVTLFALAGAESGGRGLRLDIQTARIREAIMARIESLRSSIEAALPDVESDWQIELNWSESGNNQVVFEAQNGTGDDAITIQVGWGIERLFNALSDPAALLVPDRLDIGGLLGGAVEIRTGPLPEGEPLLRVDLPSDPDIVERLSLDPGTQLKLGLWREDELTKLYAHAEGATNGLGLHLNIGQLVQQMRAAIGPRFEPILQRLDAAGDNFSGIAQRFAVAGNNLRINLGPSDDTESVYVEFDPVEMYTQARAQSLTALVPTVIHLEAELGQVDLEEGGDSGVDINLGLGNPLGTVELAAGGLSTLLRCESSAQVELAAYWSGREFGLSVVPSENATHGISAKVNIDRLQEIVENVLGGFGERIQTWLQGRARRGRGWLRSFRPTFDSGVLGFDFGEGNSIGFGLVEQVQSLFGGEGINLEGLVPDRFHFEFGENAGGIDLAPSTEALDPSFTQIGDSGFSIPLPHAVNVWLDEITTATEYDVSVDSVEVSGYYKLDGGFNLGVAIAVEGGEAIGSHRFFAFANLQPAIDRVLAVVQNSDNRFLRWLRDLARTGATAGRTLADHMSFEGGMLRFFDGGNQVGFDVRRFTDGFEAADLIPTEIRFDGESVDLAYGDAAAADEAVGPQGGGHTVVAQRPGGDTLFEATIAAPDFLQRYFEFGEGEDVLLMAAHTGDAYVIYVQYPSEMSDYARALRVDISSEAIQEKIEEWSQRAGSAGGGTRGSGRGAGGYFEPNLAYSTQIAGLGFRFGYGSFSGRVGYSAQRLLQAFETPSILALPDEVRITHDTDIISDAREGEGANPGDDVEVGVGAGMPVPGWATEAAVEDMQVPEMIRDLLSLNDSARAALFVNSDTSRGIEMYLRLATEQTVDGQRAPGASLRVGEAVINHLLDQIREGLNAAAERLRGARDDGGSRRGGERFRVGAAVRAQGFRVTGTDGEHESYIEWEWPQIIQLAQGDISATDLLPSGFRLDTGSFVAELDTSVEEGEVPSSRHDVSGLPDALKAVLDAVGISDGQVALDTPEGRPIDANGMVGIELYHLPPGEGASARKLTLQVALDALLQLLLPEGVARRMNRQGRDQRSRARSGGFRLLMPPDVETPTLEMFYVRRRRGTHEERVRISGRYTVGHLIQLLLSMDTIGDDYGELLPDSFSVALSGRKFGADITVGQSDWTGGSTDWEIDTSWIPEYDSLLANAIGQERADASTFWVGINDVDAFAEAVQDALQRGTPLIEVGTCHIVLPPDTEGEQPTVLEVGFRISVLLAVKLARAIPYVGIAIRVIEAISYVLENPEDLAYAPEAIWDMVTHIPEMVDALSRVDWESVDIGKTLMSAMMMDMPSFEQMTYMFEAIDAAEAAGIEMPDTIDGDMINEAMQNSDSLIAFAEVLHEMDPAARDELLRFANEVAQDQGMQQPGEIDWGQWQEYMDEYSTEEIARHFERVATAAARGRQVSAAGGDGEAAFQEAIAEMNAEDQAAEGGASEGDQEGEQEGDQEAETDGDGGSETEGTEQEAIEGLELLRNPPFSNFLEPRRADETDAAYTIRTRQAAAWAMQYGPLDIPHLTEALRALRDEGAPMNKQAFVANLLMERLKEERGVREGERTDEDTDQSVIDEIIAAGEREAEEMTQEAEREEQNERDEGQAQTEGFDIDFAYARTQNPHWQGRLHFTSQELIGRDVPVNSNEFALAIARAQRRLGFNLSDCDGIAGPNTVTALLESRGETGSDTYQNAQGVLNARASRDAARELVDELTGDGDGSGEGEGGEGEGEGGGGGDGEGGVLIDVNPRQAHTMITYDSRRGLNGFDLPSATKSQLVGMTQTQEGVEWTLADTDVRASPVGQSHAQVTWWFRWTNSEGQTRYETQSFLWQVGGNVIAELNTFLSSNQLGPLVHGSGGNYTVRATGEEGMALGDGYHVRVLEDATMLPEEPVTEEGSGIRYGFFDLQIQLKRDHPDGLSIPNETLGLITAGEGEWTRSFPWEHTAVPLPTN